MKLIHYITNTIIKVKIQANNLMTKKESLLNESRKKLLLK